MSSMEEIFYNSILPWLKVEGVGILIILISVFLVKRFGHMVIEKIVRRSVHREAFGTDEDEKAREEMIQKTGQMGVPVIEINSEFIVGFDKERISQLLNIK